MAKYRVELDKAAVGSLLKGKEVEAMLESFGGTIAGRAGSGYGKRTHNTGQRLICNVYAETAEARADNLSNNTLLKSLGNLPGRGRG